MNRITKRKLKKRFKDFIGGTIVIIAFISIGCLDSAENILPPIIVLLVCMVALNRMYGE